eukprot:jgi/Ulvmu1/6141/UM276_0002.1
MITPPGCKPPHVGIFCKLANRKAMIAKGLGNMAIWTQLTLTVVNRADSAQSIVRGFEHEFRAARAFKDCGAPGFIQVRKSKKRYMPKLRTFCHEFMPDGVLHVRVHLKLKLNAVVREAFGDWPWHVPQLYDVTGLDTKPMQTIHIQNLDHTSEVPGACPGAETLQQTLSAAGQSATAACDAAAAPAPAPDDMCKPLQVDKPLVTSTSHVIEQSASGNISGDFLCTFDGYANAMQDSAQHGRKVPAMKSAPFHLGPWIWKVIIPGHTVMLDPKVTPKRKQFLGVMLRISKRRAMIAQGLGSLVAQAQCTLTIMNFKGKSSTRGFEHAFSTEKHSSTHGNMFFAQFTKLHDLREDFMPDGALHVRVQLQLAIDSALIAAFRIWHRYRHLPLQVASEGISAAAAGQSSAASQCDKPVRDQVEEALKSSDCNGERGLPACGATRAALDSAMTALQQLHSRTGKLQLANSHLIGIMTALGAACQMIETDVQNTEQALAQARATLEGGEPASGAQSASSFHSDAPLSIVPGPASIPCRAASGRYSDACSHEE